MDPAIVSPLEFEFPYMALAKSCDHVANLSDMVQQVGHESALGLRETPLARLTFACAELTAIVGLLCAEGLIDHGALQQHTVWHAERLYALATGDDSAEIEAAGEIEGSDDPEGSIEV